MAGGLPELQFLNLPKIDAAVQDQQFGGMKNAIAAIQLSEARRKEAEALGLQQLWSQSGGDPIKAMDVMMRDPRYYSQAVEMQTKQADLGSKRATTRKTNIEADDKSLEVIGQQFGSLLGSPEISHQQVFQMLKTLKNQGHDVDQYFSQIPGDPAKLKPWAMSVASLGAPAKDTIERNTPKINGFNLGGAYQFADTNAITNPGIVGQSFQKTQTPDSIASNAIQIRGQNMTDARQRELAEIQRNSGKIPPGYRMSADGTRLEAIPGGPSDMGKALPSPAVKELSGAGTAYENTSRLAGSFKNDFGGKVILGDMSNTVGRIFGDDTGQAQWWQDMDAQQNQTRNDLFGSALTKTELQAWEKTSVSPNMEPKQIRENLARRTEIEARAASKLARAYQAAGYNKTQINELLGTAAQYLDNPAPPAGTGRTSSSNASGGNAATPTFSSWKEAGYKSGAEAQFDALKAVRNGAPKEQVRQRLQAMGLGTELLGK